MLCPTYGERNASLNETCTPGDLRIRSNLRGLRKILTKTITVLLKYFLKMYWPEQRINKSLNCMSKTVQGRTYKSSIRKETLCSQLKGCRAFAHVCWGCPVKQLTQKQGYTHDSRVQKTPGIPFQSQQSAWGLSSSSAHLAPVQRINLLQSPHTSLYLLKSQLGWGEAKHTGFVFAILLFN